MQLAGAFRAAQFRGAPHLACTVVLSIKITLVWLLLLQEIKLERLSVVHHQCISCVMGNRRKETDAILLHCIMGYFSDCKIFLCKSSALGEPKKYIFSKYCSSLSKNRCDLLYKICVVHSAILKKSVHLNPKILYTFKKQRGKTMQLTLIYVVVHFSQKIELNPRPKIKSPENPKLAALMWAKKQDFQHKV